MPVAITAKVDGLKGLEKSLLDLAKEYGDFKFALQAIRPAIKDALKPLVPEIKGKTPVHSGKLRDSTKLQIGYIQT